jgi:hypothetical protein
MEPKKYDMNWSTRLNMNQKGRLKGSRQGFTQREVIDYTKTFSLVSKKDSFKIVMAHVTHYDLELHQMGVKTVFLNCDLQESVYMAQQKGFAIKGKEHMGCRLKKSIYGLKQASK